MPSSVRGQDLSSQLAQGDGPYPEMAPYLLPQGGDPKLVRSIFTTRYSLVLQLSEQQVILHDNQEYQLRNVAKSSPMWSSNCASNSSFHGLSRNKIWLVSARGQGFFTRR